MPKVIKDFLSISAIVGALSMFFVFASNKWILGVETAISEVRIEQVAKEKRLSRIEAIIQEIRDRLERIERKLDRVVNDP